MKYHDVYDVYFGIDVHNPRVCELTGNRRPEIHHIDARGMGGRDMDKIENLMALERKAHEFFGDIVRYKDFLKQTHEKFMADRIPLIEYNRFHPVLQEYINSVYKIY